MVCCPSRAHWLAVIASVSCSFLLASVVHGDPEQVHVGVHQQKHTLVFFWATERRTEQSCVKYGTASERLIYQSCQGEDKQFRHGYGRYDSPWLHEINVYGFWGDKRYFYRVGDNSGGWSREFSFVTRPKDPDGEVRFVAVGDQVTIAPCRELSDSLLMMGWHGMAWHGMAIGKGWHATDWEGRGWDGMAWDLMGWDGNIGAEGMAWHGMG